MQKMHSTMFPYDCTKPEYERLLEYGIGVTLDFRSQDGMKEDSISFTPENCNYQRIVQPQQKPAQQPEQQPQPSQSEQQPQSQQPQQQ